MRAAAVWCKVVGGSETAEAQRCYDYALRGRRDVCVHDGALREGVFAVSESYGHTRHARRGRLHSRYGWKVEELPPAYQ